MDCTVTRGTKTVCKADIGTCNEPLTIYDLAQSREASALTTAPSIQPVFKPSLAAVHSGKVTVFPILFRPFASGLFFADTMVLS